MSPLDASTIAQVLAALAAVLLLAWGAARLARNRGLVTATPGRLAIRAACPLDARRRLVLIACDGREGLLLIGPTGDQFLGWVTAP
jgi:flagellar biogenesis protein FliO